MDIHNPPVEIAPLELPVASDSSSDFSGSNQTSSSSSDSSSDSASESPSDSSSVVSQKTIFLSYCNIDPSKLLNWVPADWSSYRVESVLVGKDEDYRLIRHGADDVIDYTITLGTDHKVTYKIKKERKCGATVEILED